MKLTKKTKEGRGEEDSGWDDDKCILDCFSCHKDTWTKYIAPSDKWPLGFVQITLHNCHEKKSEAEIFVTLSSSKSTITLSIVCLVLAHMEIPFCVASAVLYI